MIKSYHAEFFTATILRWQKLLQDNNVKQIVIDSLQWLVTENRCSVYAFVIMPNHIHLLWKIAEGFERETVQGAFLSFTAHAFKKYLKQNNATLLEEYYVDAKRQELPVLATDANDKRNMVRKILLQKLNYIHYILVNHIGCLLRYRKIINGHRQCFMKKISLNHTTS